MNLSRRKFLFCAAASSAVWAGVAPAAAETWRVKRVTRISSYVFQVECTTTKHVLPSALAQSIFPDQGA